MNARTSNTNGKQCGRCGGGCGGQCGCDSQCCELECLVRPNFFCGQLLTDADLAAMVEWTRSRLALARYRDGWGIACGLELSCSDPGGAVSCCDDKSAKSGPAVYLNPGYALDCCGNDLVVCEPLKVDLGPLCRPPNDPCDPRAAAAQPRAVTGAGAEADRQANCRIMLPEELLVVQLSLRYHEDLAQGQRAMFRGACSDDGPCQYARVLERPCVHLQEIKEDPSQEDGSDADRWRAAFERRLAQEIDTLRPAILGGIDAILDHIRRHPPYQFCFLESMACCLKNEAPGNQVSVADRLRIAKLLIMDWLLRQLQCPCADCLPDDGVPLGRVLLRRTVVAGRAQCTVLMIDQGAAYRRPLRKDPCRPLALRQFDLAPYLGQATESAVAQLRMRGMDCDVVEESADNNDQLGGLIDAFSSATVTFEHRPMTRLNVHVVDDITGTSRVAFFVTGRTPL